MRYVLWLDQVTKDDVPTAGGKGANLGEMVRIGMPVPSGFVVTTAAFNRLMQINGLGDQIKQIVGQTDVEDTNALMAASKKIKDLIVSQEFPNDIKDEVVESYKNLSYSDRIADNRLISLISAGRDLAFVAVRSSATAEDLPGASFAGQQASFLNTRGLKEVVESVKKCWASLFEPRAIYYRAKHSIGSASIAVVVQRMVNSDKSGVMFTVDPTTGENVIVIEATWGLGEYLVLGEVSPDHYVINKEDDSIASVKIGNKPIALMRDLGSGKSVPVKIPKDRMDARVLTDDELTKLAAFGKQLEEYYGQPQDIEFAIEKTTLRIVQTRAVTTQGKTSTSNVNGKELVKGMGASPGFASGTVKVIRNLADIAKVQQGDILVTTMTSPDLVPTMSKSAAIVTDLGGSTSHAAIVSREMGIPAVVGTGNATAVLKEGDLVTVDAYKGIVYEGRIEVEKPAQTNIGPTGPTRTKVKVNLVFAEKLDVAPKADGVGLLRIEHMITKSGIHPAKLIREGRKEDYIKILIDGIRPIAKAFSPKPVWVRTLDARSDEFRHLEGGEDEPHEDNPMLGWHGIRRSLDEPDLLRAEFEAISRMQREGLTNIHLMLPFIITVDELRRAKGIAKEISPDLKLGIMVETPAAALSIEDFCKDGLDFVSFGTNDLTMLTLGLDRNNERIAKLHSSMHPSVIKMLEYVISVCNRYGVESSICGEAGSDPEMVKLLVKAGIKSVSCEMDAIDKIRAAVFEAEGSGLDAPEEKIEFF